MFRRVKRLKAIVFILMACFLLSGNMAFADLMPCSMNAQHETSEMSHEMMTQTHCLPDSSGSLHAEECSSGLCPQCFSLLSTVEANIQPVVPSTPNVTLVVSWLPNTHSPELRPPISL